MGKAKRGISKRIRLGGQLVWGSKRQKARACGLPEHILTMDEGPVTAGIYPLFRLVLALTLVVLIRLWS